MGHPDSPPSPLPSPMLECAPGPRSLPPPCSNAHLGLDLEPAAGALSLGGTVGSLGLGGLLCERAPGSLRRRAVLRRVCVCVTGGRGE